jgi:hypothetical protein
MKNMDPKERDRYLKKQKEFYKPMFKTEAEENEQLDLWIDLINENAGNQTFLGHPTGLGDTRSPKALKFSNKAEKSQYILDNFIDRAEGGTGGRYGDIAVFDKQKQAYMRRRAPPPQKDPDAPEDSPEKKKKKAKKEKTLLQIH